MGYADQNLAPGETVVYRARYHWIFYRAAFLVLFLAVLLGAGAFYAWRKSPGSGVATVVGYLALGFAVLGALLLLARRFRASRDEYIVTDRRVIRAVGVVSRDHEQAPIDKIQDITVRQTTLGRMLGYGDVILETASERGTLIFPTIASPEEFRTAIWGRPRTSGGLGAGAAASAASIAPTASAPTPSGAAGGSAARLEELENLRRRGMVSEAEYAEKRREILSHL